MTHAHTRATGARMYATQQCTTHQKRSTSIPQPNSADETRKRLRLSSGGSGRDTRTLLTRCLPRLPRACLPRAAGPRRRAWRAMADALQSFLALAKGARGRAAVAVIADATAAPGLFAFGELLDVPNIKEARRRELSAARLGLSRFFFHILTLARRAAGGHGVCACARAAAPLCIRHARGLQRCVCRGCSPPPQPRRCADGSCVLRSCRSVERAAAAAAGAAAEAEAANGGFAGGGDQGAPRPPLPGPRR